MDHSTTLADLLQLNLHECEEEVKNIVDKAVKEMAMEKVLRELHLVYHGIRSGDPSWNGLQVVEG